jgi:hypothetical protein
MTFSNPRTMGSASPVGLVNTGPRGRSGSVPASRAANLPASVNGPLSRAPGDNPRTAGSLSLGGAVNTGPRGRSGSQSMPRTGGLPNDYAWQERMAFQRAGSPAPAAPLPVALPAARPAATSSPRPAVTQRPAAITVPGGTIEADYQVPAGSRPMPSSAPAVPAARPGTLMAPVGAGRNEQLVQAAGNAGMRLASPEAMAIASAQPMRPMVSNDGARRMLSEFGSGRPATMDQLVIPAAAFDPAGPLSPAALQASQAGFQAAAGGDRFDHLRPDIAQWARHHQNSAKGLDGMNIVDRFMAKQGAAMPLAGPSTMGFADGRQFTGPLPEAGIPDAIPMAGPSTIGFADGRQVTGPLPEIFAAQDVDPIDQVGILREMYQQRTRPQPAPF